MKRLTERDEFGNADIIGVDSVDLQLNLTYPQFNRVTEALNRLAAYEDAEEQGLLVRLPCKVGDKVYRIWKVKGRKTEISEHIMVDLVYLVQWLPKFGKTVFLTRESALEAALATALAKED